MKVVKWYDWREGGVVPQGWLVERERRLAKEAKNKAGSS